MATQSLYRSAFHRGKIILKFTGAEARVKNIVMTVVNVESIGWVVGPMFTYDQIKTEDIGPFDSAEAAAAALQLLAD